LEKRKAAKLISAFRFLFMIIQKAKDPERPQIPGLLLFSRKGGKQVIEDHFRFRLNIKDLLTIVFQKLRKKF
jgi:hypothetical protein